MTETCPYVSIIVPARNEAAQISATVEAILEAVAVFDGAPRSSLRIERSLAEVVVVDNASTDGTAEVLRPYVERHGVQVIRSERLKAPCARNDGAAMTSGQVLLFVDADTRIAPTTLLRLREHVERRGALVGLFGLLGQERSWKSRAWWAFWDTMRRLPIPEAKAMPAAMFCTRAAFERFGGFDEEVVIGEEWPITAECWRVEPERLVIDRKAPARSSSRRMDLRPFGYTRTFCRYLWAVLHVSGRRHHPDTVREVTRRRGGKGD